MFAFPAEACLFKFPQESWGCSQVLIEHTWSVWSLPCPLPTHTCPVFFPLRGTELEQQGGGDRPRPRSPSAAPRDTAAAWTTGSFACVAGSGGWISRRGDSGQGLPARTGCIFPGSIPILTRLPPGQGGWGLGVGVSGQALNLNGGGGWGDKGEAPWGGVGCTQQDHSPISWGRTGVRADGDSAPSSDSKKQFSPSLPPPPITASGLWDLNKTHTPAPAALAAGAPRVSLGSARRCLENPLEPESRCCQRPLPLSLGRRGWPGRGRGPGGLPAALPWPPSLGTGPLLATLPRRTTRGSRHPTSGRTST